MNPDFQPWLSEVDGDPWKAFCKSCKRTMGAELTSIKRHKASQHHMASMERDVHEAPPEVVPGHGNSQGVALAMILFACFIAEHNLPFTTADHLVDLMKVMFPDSVIAQSMSMKRTKCTEVVKALGRCAHVDIVNKLKRYKFSVIADRQQMCSNSPLF